MSGAQVGWTGWAGDLNGPRFAEFQRELAKYNSSSNALPVSFIFPLHRTPWFPKHSRSAMP